MTANQPLPMVGDRLVVGLREGMTVPAGWTEVHDGDVWYAWRICTDNWDWHNADWRVTLKGKGL